MGTVSINTQRGINLLAPGFLWPSMSEVLYRELCRVAETLQAKEGREFVLNIEYIQDAVFHLSQYEGGHLMSLYF